MNIDFTGKKALVTASTAGIGFAIASGLAESGAEVVINGRSQQGVDKAIARIKEQLPEAKLIPAVADLSTAEGCQKLVSAVPEVDILVNNAGIFGPADFFETDDETWDMYWATNVMSGMRLSRAYLPAMQDKNGGEWYLFHLNLHAIFLMT